MIFISIEPQFTRAITIQKQHSILYPAKKDILCIFMLEVQSHARQVKFTFRLYSPLVSKFLIRVGLGNAGLEMLQLY